MSFEGKSSLLKLEWKCAFCSRETEQIERNIVASKYSSCSDMEYGVDCENSNISAKAKV